MNKSLQLLLRLEELLLIKRTQELAASDENADLREIGSEIHAVRLRIPSALLSRYDKLSQRYSDVITVASEEVCQGCRQRISRKTASLIEESECLVACEHCGRFLLSWRQAPEYISTKH